jgi:hypothetical protein
MLSLGFEVLRPHEKCLSAVTVLYVYLVRASLLTHYFACASVEPRVGLSLGYTWVYGDVYLFSVIELAYGTARWTPTALTDAIAELIACFFAFSL